MSRFRKILKVSFISLVLTAVMVGMFHLWVIAHAKNILSEVVSRQSKGKYHLQIKKIRYNYLQLRLELQEPLLTTVDTSNNNDKITLHTRHISLQLEKFWPLIFGRRLLIDSILMDQPSFNLEHQRRNNNQITTFSLSEETEKLYQSIQNVLNTLKVANFRISNGTFEINYARHKGSPLAIKNIDFYIKGFNIDSSTVSLHPKSYTEEIQLNIAGQTIRFPDGDKTIQFKSFVFVANKGNLEVDSCSISGGENDSTMASFNLFAEKMRIKNVYLAGNDTADYNRIDSLFFTRPRVSFSVRLKDVKQDSSETISTALQRITSAAFGRLLVRYASINNVNFDIDIEKKEKTSTFNFVQDSLVVSNLGVGLFPSMPLSAASIRFGLKEFVDYFRDSTYIVHFDSVRINNEQFSLFNFNIASTPRVKKGQQKIFIPVLQIQGIDWYQLISQKKLVASSFTLNNPAISIVAAGDSRNRNLKKNSSLESSLRQTLELKNINILNGTVNYSFADNGSIIINKINTSLKPDLWVPGYLPSIQKTISHFNTGELIYFKDGWKMTAENMVYGADNSIIASNMKLSNNLQSVHVDANNVTVAGIKGKTKSNALDIKKISWENANIDMKLADKTENNNNSLLTVGAINGGPTSLKISSDKNNIDAKISRIKTAGIILVNGKPEALHNLYTEGTSIDAGNGQVNFHSGKFVIRDQQQSGFSDITASLQVKQKKITIAVPQVNLEMDVQQSLSNPFDVSWLNILQPKIDIVSTEPTSLANTKQEKLLPEINLRNIMVTDPVISFHDRTGKEPFQLKLGSSSLSAGAINTSDNGQKLSISDGEFQSKQFSFVNSDSLQIFATGGIVTSGLKTFTMRSGGNSWDLSGGVIDLSNITLLNKRNSGGKDTLQLASLHVNSFSLDNKNLIDLPAYLSSSPVLNASNINLSYRNEKNRFRIKNGRAGTSSFALDSFLFRPQQNRTAFMAAQTYQKDFITLDTGPLFFEGINIASWLKDSILKVGHIQIGQAVLNDTRDKNLPLQTGIIKGLPTNIIKNLPVKMMIDSITISDGRVRYHEISEKTKQTGNIRFTKLRATLRNIKNYDLQLNDSLYVQASGYIMDSGFAQLRMRESYTDSLATFPITMSAGAFDPKILNPFLLPVISAKVKTGVVDSIHFKAVGREYLALGEMQFFYHDLTIEFLKDGDEQKKTFLTSLITFAANSFAIRNNNRKRIGTVFYERTRNRSFFNYLVKMIGSGVASSVGAKRNKKYNKLYKEKIRELNLPDVEE